MRKLNQFKFYIFLILVVLASCSPTKEQITKLLEDNPEILTKAMEKNPAKFMESFRKVAQNPQFKNQAADREKMMEAEFKNPLKPEIDEKRGFMGNIKAPITIVEYTDFQCPFCGKGYATLEEIRKTYGAKIRVVVKNLPLPMHPLAQPAAKRFEALRLQSPEKAFAFYHQIFSNQKKLDGGEKYLDSLVKKTGANFSRVQKDMQSESVTKIIEKDMAEAKSFGIMGTPAFVINGVSLRGAFPADAFKRVIDRKLAEVK